MGTYFFGNTIGISTTPISFHVSPVVVNSNDVYTAPANGYGIVTVYHSGTVNISLDGQLIFQGLAAGTTQNIYVGPGQTLNVNAPLTTEITAKGVTFVNTP